jgi:aspartyl-tRNA(Asn)/glutamyl-tRNA(Gln) amidotransferase subunit B
MEEGSLRCDANVSIRPIGDTKLGVKTEVKNINSFKFVQKALEYEISRQIKAALNREPIIQETRLWNVANGVTESMRAKEEAHDYRYFPEPDLTPIMLDQQTVESLRRALPELPDQIIRRFITTYELPRYDAEFLAADKAMATWFEQVAIASKQPKAASNWVMGELTRLLNEQNQTFDVCPLKPRQLADMLDLLQKGVISGKTAKTVFQKMFITQKDAETIVKEEGLLQISDADELERQIEGIIQKNSNEVKRYKDGEIKLIGFFVGQIMKATKGKANPALVNEILLKKLAE